MYSRFRSPRYGRGFHPDPRHGRKEVFYCSDQGGNRCPAPAVTVCDCAYGSASYGQVLAQNTDLTSLGSACKAYYTGAIIQNCQSTPAPQGSVSSATAIYGSANYGQVLAGINQLGGLIQSCHQSYVGAILKNCKAH